MGIGTLRRAFTAGTALSAALVVGAAGGTVAAVLGAQAAAASSVGGPVTRSETLQRAQYWVDRGVTYTQTGPWASDPQGKTYRRDCSGLVSMAWHLPDSRSTRTFLSWSGKQQLPSLHDLKTGDAVLRDGHIELFDHWVNGNRHEDGAYVYSFNNPGETVQNPYAVDNYGRLGKDSWSELTTYIPIRYNNIADDGPPPGSPDNSVLREPNGAISLVVGGAPFHLTPAEYAALGSPPATAVPEGTFASMPGIIANGTYVRTADDGAIYVIAGSAKYHLNPSEYAALGAPPARNVPNRLVGGLGGVPADNTFLRDPASTAIYQVVSGAKYHLDPAEYAGLGSPAATNVPAGFIATVTASVPVDSVFLRDPVSTAIYQIVGGARYHLSPAEYSALGTPTAINVPIGFINRTATEPRDGSFIRDITDGAIYQIVGGAKYHLSPSEYSALDSAPSTNVPHGLILSITRTLPSAGYLRNRDDGAIYQVINGARYHLSPAEYAELGAPAAVNVPVGFINRLGPVPADNSFLRDISDTAIYQIVGGAKYHLTPAEYTALGTPAAVNVPHGFAAAVTGTQPAGSLILRDPVSTAIYQVVNGAKFHLNPAEYALLGSPAAINVPAGLLDRLGTTPTDGTLLRDIASTAIYSVTAGTKHHLTPAEYAALPDQLTTNVTARFLATFPDA
jgi:rhodanese-related sulfurtransferase